MDWCRVLCVVGSGFGDRRMEDERVWKSGERAKEVFQRNKGKAQVKRRGSLLDLGCANVSNTFVV